MQLLIEWQQNLYVPIDKIHNYVSILTKVIEIKLRLFKHFQNRKQWSRQQLFFLVDTNFVHFHVAQMPSAHYTENTFPTAI